MIRLKSHHIHICKMIEIKIGKVGIKLVKKRVPFAKLIQLRT